MIRLKYDNFNFDESNLPDFVEMVSTHQYGKKVILKDKYASGDYKLLQFANGFYAYASNYILNEDFELQLSVAKDDFLALHINQIQAGPEFKISLNDDHVSYDDKVVNSVFLTSSKDDFIVAGVKGACVNRLKIMIPKTWVEKAYPAFNEAMLNAYTQLGEKRLFFDTMDSTYRSMVDKVMNTEENAFYIPVTQNILEVIAERFLNRITNKLQKNQKETD